MTVLMCAQKLTDASLIYHTTTTKQFTTLNRHYDNFKAMVDSRLQPVYQVNHCGYFILLPTALTQQVMQLPLPVCPSICFHSIFRTD